MKNSYHKINNVETHLMTWGNPFNCDGSDVVICVTGNPGLPDFYTEFGSVLYEKINFPICIIGQSGHEIVPDKSSNVLYNQEHLFNLKGQLNHKLDLIMNLIDKKSKLHLIGHSIGAWMLIEILHSNQNLIERVHSVNLLFPTVQKMVDTFSGYIVNNVFRRLHYIILLIIHLFYLLPESTRKFMISIYLKLNSLPQHYIARIIKYLNPKVMEKVLFLAYDEMDTVGELNVDGINEIKHLTNVIYSIRDPWAPLKYMDDLKRFQPELTMKEVDINHAFVLKSSERVGEMVSDIILNNSGTG